jgi:chromosome segregation ATPase
MGVMTKWKVATLVLALAVVGIGAYALSLRSDIEDKDAQIAAQQEQLAEREGIAGDVQEAAAGLAENAQQAFGQLGDQLDEIEGTQADAQAAIDAAEQAAADAKARADSAEDEVEEAEARADEATAKADAAAACARGYLSAVGDAFDAASVSEGVSEAMTDIEALNASCAETLGS